MKNINQIIDEVLRGKLELRDDLDPDFREYEYTDGPSEHYIVHHVKGTEISLHFPEQDYIKEAREKNYVGDISDEELQEIIDNTNGLDDQFNYDKVEAFEDLEMGLQWL